MFKILKYFFVISLYKKAKKQFVILAISLITILLSSLIISDVMMVVSGLNLYILIVIKWMIILSMLVLIGLKLLKIIELAMPAPLTVKQTKYIAVADEAVNRKKEITLKKDRLFTESEQIIQKYIRGARNEKGS